MWHQLDLAQSTNSFIGFEQLKEAILALHCSCFGNPPSHECQDNIFNHTTFDTERFSDGDTPLRLVFVRESGDLFGGDIAGENDPVLAGHTGRTPDMPVR